MKKITIITCVVIITCALMAFTFSSRYGIPSNIIKQTAKKIDPPTLNYDLSPRCKNTITHEKMHRAQTVSDLIPDFSIQENLKNNIISVRDIEIRIEATNSHYAQVKPQKGHGNNLSKEQISLLKSTDYSTDFYLEGYITHDDLKKDRYFNYCMTVIPEKQATYKTGTQAFINFLASKCQSTIAAVQKGSLQSGKISFIVSKTGILSDIEINSSCGYPSIDEKMVELMNDLPDGWHVATNSKGEKVNQTLVFSYGQIGC